MKVLPAFLKAYSDSSFTNPHEVVLDTVPPDCMGNFTHMGAKYWGFETSRHIATSINQEDKHFSYNAEAHHWLDIGLRFHSEIHKISISTKWFTGNQVPEVSVELFDKTTGQTKTILDHVPLQPDTEHEFDIEPIMASDCHVKCYSEGGIARVNLLGHAKDALYERPNLLSDADISHTSNDHYGSPLDAVNGNREVQHMVGWESARTGFGEHTIFTLARPAVIDTIVVDTYMHRLNPPLSCHIFAAQLESPLEDSLKKLPRWKLVFPDGDEIIPEDFQKYMLQKSFSPQHKQFDIKLHHTSDSPWKPLVSFAPLKPDTWHEFANMESTSSVNVIYYMHYPNGGIHGLKMFGQYS